MKNKKQSERFWTWGIKGVDTNLIIITIFLIVFGLIMIYSASYYKSSMDILADMEKLEMLGNIDSMAFLRKQLIFSVLGIAVMFAVSSINYHLWEEKFIVRTAIVLSVILTLVLLTRFFGENHPLNFTRTVNGATRWIEVGPIGFQVAEPVKIAVIVSTAAIISKFGKNEVRWKKFTWVKWIKSFKILLPGVGLSLFLGIVSNNMSSAIIIALIGLVVYFAWHPKSKIFYGLIAAGIVLGGILLLFVWKDIQKEKAEAEANQAVESVMEEEVPEEEKRDFRSKRIRAWLDPYSYSSDTSYQNLQALYAIGSGGLFGKGLGNSIQKLGAMPEPYNDFIFAIVCEELGVMGASLLMLMFIYLLYRIYCIAQNAEDLFGKMIVTGVFVHIALQVVMNIAVVTGSMPNTGVTLPFISYGGTATVFLLIELGMVLNVQKLSEYKRIERIRETRLN